MVNEWKTVHLAALCKWFVSLVVFVAVFSGGTPYLDTNGTVCFSFHINEARADYKTSPFGATVTLSPIDGGNPAYTYLWFGSFGSTTGLSPQVYLPQGENLVTYYVDNGSTFIDKQTITVSVVSKFNISLEGTNSSVKVAWTSVEPRSEIEKFEIYKADIDLANIGEFIKVAETVPGSKGANSYTDRTVQYPRSYLYVICELRDGQRYYSYIREVKADRTDDSLSGIVFYTSPITTAAPGVEYMYRVGVFSANFIKFTPAPPDGMILDPAGYFSGESYVRWKPDTTGSYPVRIEAQESGFFRQQAYTLQVSSYPVPVSVNLSADQAAVEPGQTVRLSWDSAYAEKVTIDQGVGDVPVTGYVDVPIQEDTTFTITASALGNTATDSVTVTVGPSVSIQATPSSIPAGSSSTLTWTSANADTVSIDQGIGDVPLDSSQGGVAVTPASTTTYTITAIGMGQTVTDTVQVEVYPVLQLQVDSPVDGLQTTSPTITVSGQVSAGASVTINGSPATVNGNAFSEIVQLGAPGPHAITIVASDTHGQQITEVRNVTYTCAELILQIDAPTEGATVSTPDITVTGQVNNNASVVVNGVTATVANGQFTALVTFGAEGPQTITATATDICSQQQTQTVNVNYYLPPTATLSADPSTIAQGESATLSWTSTHCNSADLQPEPGAVACEDSAVVSPAATTTYTLTVNGPGGAATSQATLTVVPPAPGATFGADATDILIGETARLNWSTVGADSCTLEPGAGDVPVNGTMDVSPRETTTYTLTATNQTGSTTRTITINVDSTYPQVDISADLHRITSGDSIVLSWDAANVDTCSIDPDLGDVAASGTTPRTLTQTLNYTITCTGAGVEVSDNVVVVVDDPYGDPTPEEQAHLEAINRARANPTAEAARLGIDLNEGLAAGTISADPLPPLRFNSILRQAAMDHTTDMINNHYVGHYGSDGSTPEERCAAAGYEGITGENVAAYRSSAPLDAFQTSLQLYDDLFVDANYPGRGHRINILSDLYREIGCGFIAESYDPAFPYGGTVTCNFGKPADIAPSVVGIVYDDKNSNSSYDADEGIASVLVEDLEGGDSVYTATAGGYALVLPPGVHTLQFTLPDGRSITRAVTMASENIKLDIEMALFSDALTTTRISSIDQAIEGGQSTRLVWESANATYASIDNGIGYVPVNGAITVTPIVTTTYTITAEGPTGSVTSSVTVHVNDFSAAPTVDITASAALITQGENVLLTWTSTNAQHLYIDNDIGSVLLDDSASMTPNHTTTYTITASSRGGVVSKKVTVAVYGSPELQPAGSFGGNYSDLIPADATVAAYDADRFGLIAGQVLGIAELPLPGVQVTVLEHPEYGTAIADANGRFAIPVEGGTSLTVSYRLDGYITAQRRVYTPWNDTALAATVQLLQVDTASTEVNLDGNPNTVIVHQSSQTNDTFGARTTSMVFQGDNRAFIVDENGNAVQEITRFTARATEYKTPRSMPAELPETSAFTFCTELSIDGVERVRFEKPVVTWVDNFLGFDIGEPVPAGYYDRDKGQWVPSENGLVVQLLDTDSDGIVDAVDGDGDGQADDLNQNGATDDEAIGLSDPAVYIPGTTYWRVPVTHFTPWDYNWCSFYSLLRMLGYAGAWANLQQMPCPDGNCTSVGSYVEDESLIFHEDIAIPGTGLSLHYASDRTAGFKTQLSVPVSGSEVPASVKRIIARVEVAGRVFEQELPPDPEQVAEISWDGLDFRGQLVAYPLSANVSIGYVYDSVYMSSGYLDMAFGDFGLGQTQVPTREEVIAWKKSTVDIDLTDKQFDIAQGWTISARHRMHPSRPDTLHKGNGTVVRNATPVMTTIAGDGTEGWFENGASAVATSISHPSAAALNAKGELFVANQIYPGVVKIHPDGTLEVIAGGEFATDTTDESWAIDGRLESPTDIAVDAEGNLYIADRGLCKVKKVDPDGYMTTIAGTGECVSDVSGKSALETAIVATSIALDDSGNLLIVEGSVCVGGSVDPVSGECIGGTVEEGGYRVRKVNRAGIVRTVAGTGIEYDPNVHSGVGDDGPAIDAYFFNPQSIAADHDGNLYVADGPRIRKINPSGIITTIAGTGFTGYTGDGGPAVDAQITTATGVSLDGAGNIFFSQAFDNGDVVRKISADGTISTIAGEGTAGMDGDNGPATGALLNAPRRMAVAPDGVIYVPDLMNHRVRRIHTLNYAESDGTAHVFDTAGRHLATKDLETGQTLLAFGYDQDGRLDSITDIWQNQVTIERDAYGVPTAVIGPAPLHLRTDLVIDANNQLTEISFADTNYYSFEYGNNDGLLTAKTEPNQNRFEHFYDSNGRMEHSTDQEGGIWQFPKSMAADGQIQSTVASGEETRSKESRHQSTGAYQSVSTAASGARTSYVRSADRLTEQLTGSSGTTIASERSIDPMFGYTYLKKSTVTTPAGLTKVTEIGKSYTDGDQNGVPENITVTATSNGKTTVLSHDVTAATTVLTTPELRTVETTYDPATLQTMKVSVPGLHDTFYDYYADGKIKSVIVGTRETHYTYDPGTGWLDTVTVRKNGTENLTTQYTLYDQLGRVEEVLRPDSSTVGFDYDENGNQVLLTNPTPVDHDFEYNRVNLRKTYFTPLSGNYQYLYDKDKRLQSVTAPSGAVISFAYDAGRLDYIQTPESTIDYAYRTDDPSKIDAVTKGSEAISYQYDGDLVTDVILSGTVSSQLAYQYNNDLWLQNFTYAGQSVAFAYDNDGLLTGAGSYTIYRNQDNGLPEAVSGGGLQVTRTFNGYGEVSAEETLVNGQSLVQWTLVRDDRGLITSKTELVKGQNGKTPFYEYAYDDFGRLLTVTLNGKLIEAYTYDQAGRRQSETNTNRGISDRSYSYSDEDHLLSAGTVSCQHDLDGFLTTKTDGTEVTSYDYSARGELLEVQLPDGRTVIYTHDPLGRRIAKQIDGVTVEKYLWQGRATLLAVYDGADNLIQRFEYADGRMPVAMTQGGSTYYLGYDQVGTLRIVADGSGNVVKRIDYDAFGNIIDDTNSSLTVPFGFAGGLHDRDTGLVRFGFRDYDPETGRWTAKDPIDFAGGDMDLYGYASNNPVNLIDPLGLSKQKIIVRGGYRFVMNPGDTMHGGRHWHVYKGKSNKLLGRMSLDGKTLTGSISKRAKKLAKKAGIISLLFTAYEVYDAATATKAEAFEDLMDKTSNWPEPLQEEFINFLLMNNLDFFEIEGAMPDSYTDWDSGCP